MGAMEYCVMEMVLQEYNGKFKQDSKSCFIKYRYEPHREIYKDRQVLILITITIPLSIMLVAPVKGT